MATKALGTTTANKQHTADGEQAKGTHPHDTVEGELGLILVVASLSVAFAGVIVGSVEGDQLDTFNIKCAADRASDNETLSDIAGWCNSTTNFLPTVSWLALLTGAMSFLGSIILYVAWRSARPESEDYDGSNVFFKSISAKVTIVYVLLGLSILFICFAQLLLQLYKFPFRFHGTIVTVGIVIVMLFIGFGIWTYVDYYRYTKEQKKK